MCVACVIFVFEVYTRKVHVKCVGVCICVCVYIYIHMHAHVFEYMVCGRVVMVCVYACM